MVGHSGGRLMGRTDMVRWISGGLGRRSSTNCEMTSHTPSTPKSHYSLPSASISVTQPFDTIRCQITSCWQLYTFFNQFYTFLCHVILKLAVSRSRQSASAACMSILLIVGPKYTLPCRVLPPGESRWACRRDRQTDGHLTVTLCFPLDAASIIICLHRLALGRKLWTSS